MLTKNNIFAFEGIDGSGKTTLITNLKKRLELKGFKIIVIGGIESSELGQLIRSYFLNNKKISNKTRFLLSFANMVQIQSEIINPNQNPNTIFLIDRWILSNLAYQAIGNEVDSYLKLYHQLVEKFIIIPKRTFLLDIDPKIGLSRKKNQSTHQLDEIEKKDLSYFHKVRKAYLDLKLKNVFSTALENVNQIQDKIEKKILKSI